ncbi:MAG: hypothetical protein JWL85_616 [Candidatus Saccharibacteria bacterium]|nr:hypothetical protein [Candidatus Saccharibacteria bacterium]
MSEQLRHSPESRVEHIDTSEESKQNLERIKQLGKESKGKDDETISRLQQAVEQQAISGKELSVGNNEATTQSSPLGMHRELKTKSFKRSMQRIRSQLSLPERTFSKVVHQPMVDRISETAGKTITRPSGILGGGIAALIGSAYLLYITKYYGFEYNYSVFIVLFATGFFAGLLIELVYRLFKKH